MKKSERIAAFLIFIGTVFFVMFTNFVILILPVIWMYEQRGASMLFFVAAIGYVQVMLILLLGLIGMEICAIKETYDMWRSNEPEIFARFKEEFKR
jgi:hypothetical protein